MDFTFADKSSVFPSNEWVEIGVTTLKILLTISPRWFHQMSSSWRNSPNSSSPIDGERSLRPKPGKRSRRLISNSWPHSIKSLTLQWDVFVSPRPATLLSWILQWKIKWYFCKIIGRSQLRLHYCIDGISGGLRVSTLTVMEPKPES